MRRRCGRVWLVLGFVGALGFGRAAAQETPPPPAVAAPETAATAMAALLGGAEYMLVLERSFEAEKLFSAVLAQDPSNAHAKDGLRRAALAKRTSWALIQHYFNNNLDASLFAFAGGPTFFTSHGKATVWIGDGYFKNDINPNNPRNPLAYLGGSLGTSDDAALQRISVNGIWEPYYKQFDGYVYLNHTFYPAAPDRTLWFVKGTWNRRQGREFYSAFAGVHDSYIQSDLAQFFAPESYTAVVDKTLSREVGVAAQLPLGSAFDFVPSYSHFHYSDGNARRIARAQLLYRVLPRGGKALPIFRVGVAYLSDDGDVASESYYMPLGFSQVAIVADYVFVSGKYRYGVFGSWPLTGTSGEGHGRFDPPRTLFSFINYKLSPSRELWVKVTGVYTGVYPHKAGANLFDIVTGINLRF